MDKSYLNQMHERLGCLTRHLTEARASAKALRAYQQCSPEGQQFTAQLLQQAANQLASHAQEFRVLAEGLCRSLQQADDTVTPRGGDTGASALHPHNAARQSEADHDVSSTT